MSDEQEIGQRSRQTIAYGEPEVAMKLKFKSSHICDPGEHCLAHGYDRAPVFTCCHCGSKFEIDDESNKR